MSSRDTAEPARSTATDVGERIVRIEVDRGHGAAPHRAPAGEVRPARSRTGTQRSAARPQREPIASTPGAGSGRRPRRGGRSGQRRPAVAVRTGVAVAGGVLLFVLAFLAAGVLAGSGGIPGFSGGASMEAIEDEAVNAVPTPEDLAPAESAPVRANGHPLLERPEPALPVSTAPRTAPAPAPPAITAKRSVVMDGRTGEVLFARDADVAVPVASCIKILTALTVLRFTDPGEIVTVGQEAADVGEREIYLSPGEQLPVETLTGAMLVGSANDAAAALGLHVGGTMPGYAAVANWVAHRLGAKNTNVKNPHGLDEAGHVSTAYDLAVLARAGLADPVFANWVRTPQYSLPWPGHPGPRVATSHNKLLRTYQGAVGVKTGMTNGSGNSLVGAATRGEQTFIVVSLSSQNPTADDTALLDWAFAAFSTVRLVEAGSTVTDGDGVERVSDTDLWATVPKEAASRLGVRYLDGRLEGVLDGEVVSYVAARRAG